MLLHCVSDLHFHDHCDRGISSYDNWLFPWNVWSYLLFIFLLGYLCCYWFVEILRVLLIPALLGVCMVNNISQIVTWPFSFKVFFDKQMLQILIYSNYFFFKLVLFVSKEKFLMSEFKILIIWSVEPWGSGHFQGELWGQPVFMWFAFVTHCAAICTNGAEAVVCRTTLLALQHRSRPCTQLCVL